MPGCSSTIIYPSVERVDGTHRQFKIREKWNELFQVGWNIRATHRTALKKCKDKAVDSFINRLLLALSTSGYRLRKFKSKSHASCSVTTFGALTSLSTYDHPLDPNMAPSWTSSGQHCSGCLMDTVLDDLHRHLGMASMDWLALGASPSYFPGKIALSEKWWCPWIWWLVMIVPTKMSMNEHESGLYRVVTCQAEGKRCTTLRGSQLIHSSAVARSASVTLVRMSLGVGVASRASCSQPCKEAFQNHGLLPTDVALSSHDLWCLWLCLCVKLYKAKIHMHIHCWCWWSQEFHKCQAFQMPIWGGRRCDFHGSEGLFWHPGTCLPGPLAGRRLRMKRQNGEDLWEIIMTITITIRIRINNNKNNSIIVVIVNNNKHDTSW